MTNQLSLVALTNAILRERRLVSWICVVLVALVTAVTLTRHRTYTSHSSFYPLSRRSTSISMGGLASQLGLPSSVGSGLAGQLGGLGQGEPSQSPAFYSALMTNRVILIDLAHTRFHRPGGAPGDSADVATLLNIGAATPVMRDEKTIAALRRQIVADVSPRTGLIDVSVTAEDPDLATAMHRRLLDLVNDFNLRTRRTQATLERSFLEGRLSDAQRDMRASEDRLEEFLSTNRAGMSSPTLRFQQDRLARAVDFSRSLYTSLVQAVEQARLEEIREAPVITVVEQPAPPALPDPRGLLVRGLLAIFVGLGLGALVVAIRAAIRAGNASGDPEFSELATLRREAMHDIVRPWRLLTKNGSSNGHGRSTKDAV